METIQQTEVQQFQHFLADRSVAPTSLDQAVSEFREYQRQLDKLFAMLKVAEEEDARGEGMPFDLEAAKRRLEKHIQDARQK